MSIETDEKEDRDLNTVAAGSNALNVAGPYGALAAMLIQGGIFGYKAYKQNKQAKELEKHQRPEYEIPSAIREAINSAKLQAANSRLPGQNLMEQKLDNNTSAGISSLKEVSNNPNDLATNIARLYASQQGAQNGLNIAGAQNYNNNQSMLRSALGQEAFFQDKKWDYNQFQPYANDMAASSALREGAFRNATAAAGNLAQGVGGVGALLYAQNQMKKAGQEGQEDQVGGYAPTPSTGGFMPAGQPNNMIPQNYSGGLPGAINGMPTQVNTVPQNNAVFNRMMEDYQPSRRRNNQYNSPYDFNYK